ncbi:MAG: MFS transporter [Thermoleophilia bacterium]
MSAPFEIPPLPVAPSLDGPSTGGDPPLESGADVPGTRPRLWTRGFLLLLGATAFYFMGFQLLLPTIPLYAVQLGGGEAAAGLVLGAFTFSAMLVRPISGWALDAYGRRALYLLGAVLSLLTIFAHEWVAGVGLLLILRLIHGVGFGLSTTAGGTIASDLVPRSRLGEGMGFFTLAMSLPLAVAPALGIWMIGGGDFSALFVLSGLLTIGSLVFAAMLRMSERERPTRGAGRRMTLGSFVERDSLFPSLILFFMTLSYGPILAFIALYGEQRGIGGVGVFFTVFALVLAVVRPLSGTLADRVGYEPTVVAGLVFAAAGLLVLAAAGTLWLLLVAAALYGVGYGTCQPSLQALAVYRVSSARRGAATATFFTAYDLGMATGSIAGGFLAAAVSLSGVFALSVIPIVLAAGLLLRHQRGAVPARAAS